MLLNYLHIPLVSHGRYQICASLWCLIHGLISFFSEKVDSLWGVSETVWIIIFALIGILALILIFVIAVACGACTRSDSSDIPESTSPFESLSPETNSNKKPAETDHYIQAYDNATLTTEDETNKGFNDLNWCQLRFNLSTRVTCWRVSSYPSAPGGLWGELYALFEIMPLWYFVHFWSVRLTLCLDFSCCIVGSHTASHCLISSAICSLCK